MKKILVPIDFSPSSINAANYALELAQSLNAELSLLHILELPALYPDLDTMTTNEEERIKEVKEKLDELKNGLIHKANANMKIEAEVRPGTVLPGIAEHASAIRASLVVMTRRNVHAVERLILGSVTSALMKVLHIPVLVIPIGVRFTRIRKVVFACDLENIGNEMPYDQIRSIVRELNAEFHILNITSHDNQALSTTAQTNLDILRKNLHEVTPIFNYSANSEISTGINDFVEKMYMDLVIVAPRSYPIVKELFHHSKSLMILKHTHIPVVSVLD